MTSKNIRRVEETRLWVADLECPTCGATSVLEITDSVTERVTMDAATSHAFAHARHIACPDGCDKDRP
jgi:hypothetical protein